MRPGPEKVKRWRPRSLAFVAHLNHVTAHIIAALRADGMRRHRGTALWAEASLLGLLVMMTPTSAGTRVGMASLWHCHGRKPSKKHYQFDWDRLVILRSSASYGQTTKLSSRKAASPTLHLNSFFVPPFLSDRIGQKIERQKISYSSSIACRMATTKRARVGEMDTSSSTSTPKNSPSLIARSTSRMPWY